jgi:hypothetical protein
MARPAAQVGKLAVQAGTPLHVLQELGGWECVTVESVNRTRIVVFLSAEDRRNVFECNCTRLYTRFRKDE